MISENYIAVENPSQEERMSVMYISIIMEDIYPGSEMMTYLSLCLLNV